MEAKPYHPVTRWPPRHVQTFTRVALETNRRRTPSDMIKLGEMVMEEAVDCCAVEGTCARSTNIEPVSDTENL